MVTRPTEHDIVLHLHLAESEGINGKALMRMIDIVETSLYESDRTDLAEASRELNIPDVIRDAALERLRHHRHERLVFRDARSGSIELIGLVAAVALFVLNKTIGEALSQGVKESLAFRNLKEFFRCSIDRKAARLAQILQRSLGTSGMNVGLDEGRGPNGVRVIVIRVTSGTRPLAGSVPTLGAALDSDNEPPA